MRKKIVAGNWKMHKTYEQGISLASEVINMVKDEVHGSVEAILAVPFIHLASVAKLAGGKVVVAAQDCHIMKEGAYTGDISAEMVASTGAKYVLVGHSERREYHNEQAPTLYKKILAAQAAGLTPIFCCGETKDIREAGTQNTFVGAQLQDALFALSESEIKNLVIAYEPVWAIGTGLTATPEMAQDMHAVIRQKIAGQYGAAIAEDMSILYGGSVKAANAQSLFSQPDIDGGLVGGASLQSREFVEIVKAI